MRYCALCHKKGVPGSGTFFNVPRNRSKRAEWAKLLKKEINSSTSVCIDHFSKDDIATLGSRCMLLPKAVPIVEEQEEPQVLARKTLSRKAAKTSQMEYQLPATSAQGLRYFTYEELTSTATSKSREQRSKVQETHIEFYEKAIFEARCSAPFTIRYRERKPRAQKGEKRKVVKQLVNDHDAASASLNEEDNEDLVMQPKEKKVFIKRTNDDFEVKRKSFQPNISNAGQPNISNQSSSTQKNLISKKLPRHTFAENRQKTLKRKRLDIDFVPPQLDEPEVQIPVVKSVYCSGYTQTNSRLCGLVEASDLADDFRFNCFYCSEVFPLEKWLNFVSHLKERHFKEEEAFKTTKYLSNEHDYTPIILTPPAPANDSLEPKANSAEPSFSVLVDPLASAHNPFESIVFNSSLSCTPYRNTTKTYFGSNSFRRKTKALRKNSKRKLISSKRYYSKLTAQQTSKRSALSRCLKRTIQDEVLPPPTPPPIEDDSYETCPTAIDQKIPTEIAFEYTPPPVVNLLLDNMINFPVLWQFDEEPFNEDFFEAVEELCNIINDKFSLNIDNLKMRRSINRILRFYCYIYPNENNDKFTEYYDKCDKFLPCVSQIAYARCAHCYVCYSSDFDLKLHLVEEQKYLEWPYKCAQCKECFRLWDEYEFHKYLPHYDEIFRCQPCKLSFFRRLSYKKHMVEEHQRVSEPGRFKCDICDKSVETLSGLRVHKKFHGEKEHKCHLCPKSYHERSKLQLHLKIHRQEHDYMCEICGKKFIRQAALRIHMTKHTGEKVTCKICNLRLRKSSLGRHLRIAHVVYAGPITKSFCKGKKISLGKILKARPKRPSLNTNRSEREYKCRICKVSFDNYKLTVQHNKEVHADLPRWPCKMCEAEFKSKINLKAHYRRKHKLHALQVYKLVEENEDLSNVLSIEAEEIEEIFETLKNTRNNPENTTKSNTPSIKTDLLPDEVYFAEEKVHSSTIQDEIMKAVDDIETEDIKIDYINDIFTDFLP